MSLYEIHYVNSASEQARLKEQQKKMLQSLQELATTAKLQQQQEQEQVLTRQHHLKSQQRGAKSKSSISSIDTRYCNSSLIEIAAECRPYSPYTQLSTLNSSAVVNFVNNGNRQRMTTSVSTSTTSSVKHRQRIPSMSSARSSFVSSIDTESIPETEVDKYDGSYKSALETTGRDQYGFKKPTQWVKVNDLNEFHTEYKTVLQKQSKTWVELLQSNSQQWPPMCPELTRHVRKGIPQDIRTKAWMHYSGADKKMKAKPGIYQSLIIKAEQLSNSNEYTLVIEKDLHRTFPDNSLFACNSQEKDGSIKSLPESNPKLQMLHRVLLAFSLYAPEIGYCQSLNFVAGFLLLFEEEEEAFWMLITIIYDFFPKNMFDATMEGANIEQTVLMMMIYEKMPGIWSKIADKKCFWECEQTDNLPPVTLVTSHWFLTLYINILPVETVLRIWDCFFVGDGLKILYQVALTIMKLNEQALWNVDDSVDTFQILQNMPKRLYNCHEFIKSVFSPDGVAFDLTLQEIDQKRDLFKNRKSQRIRNM